MEDKQADYSSLVAAIEKGDLEQTKDLLPPSVSDSITDQGDTALHVAVGSNQPTIIDYLCEREADTKKTNATGNTPLHVACGKGHAGLVGHLVRDLHFDPHVCNSSTKRSLLHIAVVGDSYELVKYLVGELSFDPLDLDGEGLNSLHIAARQGLLEVVRYFVADRRCDPSCVTATLQQQPIHFAVSSGKMDLAKYLVEGCSCDPSALDASAKTPLHFCTRNTSVDLVRYLVEERGCDPSRRSEASGKTAAGRVPLHGTSFEDNLPVMKYLVESCHCDPQVADEAGITLVSCAAQEGHLEMVRYLCDERGCDASVQDDTGKTPLHYSCMKGRLDIVKFLIVGCGANINVLDNSGESPILNAARGNQENVVEYLVFETECDVTLNADGSGKNAFHYAVSNGWLKIVRHLVESRGLDPESFGESFTAIHCAAQGGAVEVLKFFMEDLERKGDRVNIMSREQGGNGSTPLFQACTHNRLEVVKYLLAECDCGFVPSKGKELSPLHAACSGGHLKLTRYLVKERDHPVEPTDHQGAIPLHLALLNGRLRVSKFLVEECNSDPMTRTKNGATGIHAVCQGGHLDCLKFLIDKVGSLVDWSLEKGGTPLDRATEHGHLELVKYMVVNNICNPRLKVANGRAALHVAAGKGCLHIVEYLVDEVECDVLDVDNHGQIPLHHACNKKDNAPVIKYLLKKNKAQLSCKNANSETPIQVAKKSDNLSCEILEAFLECGTSFSQLADVAPKSCSFLAIQQHPFYSPLKIFCLGHTTPLVKLFAVEGEELENMGKFRWLTRNNNYLNDVAVFEVADVTTSRGGVLYDSLATCEHPVFVVGASNIHSLEEVQYWSNHYLQYIDHLLQHSHQQQCKPFVLFAIEVDAPIADEAYTHLLTLQLPRHKQVTDTRIVQFLPPQAGKFVLCLSKFINMLQPSSCLSPSLSALKLFVSQHFRDELYCSLSSLQAAITDAEAPLPTEPAKIAKTLRTLTQSISSWFLIEDEKELLNSWIILEAEVFLVLLQSEIGGKQALMSHSLLISQNAGLDPSLFINALLYFNIISPVNLPPGEALEEDAKLYFIPSALPSSIPSSFVIDKQPNTIATGWLLQCQPPNLFSPVFCLRLPAVAAVVITNKLLPGESKFDSTESCQDKLTLWKYGMHWTSDTVEVLVMTLKAEAMLLIVKTNAKDALDHSTIKSRVIRAVNALNKELHPGSSTPLEYVLHPSCLELFKVEENPALGCIAVSDVMSTLENTQEMFGCSHNDLFGFDPLLLVHHTDLLHRLYDSANEKVPVSQDDLDVVSSCFVGFCDELQVVLNCPVVFPVDMSGGVDRLGLVLRTWSNDGATYRDLRLCFEKYSMFAERDSIMDMKK